MASLQVTAFANTFLVTKTGLSGPVLRVVGPEETRKKRPHRKSRLGCIRCKRRKVKCDEGDPCRNCVKRKEACVRASPASSNQEGSESPPPELALSPLSEPECGPINLLHMELLHHFERHTIHTLSFQSVWPRMLQLAFHSRQHTYLVSALLSVSAAHLDYLVPNDPRYHRAKYALLDKALHDYRGALSTPITADNCDALLGTANLIQFLMWSDLSFMDGQSHHHHHHHHHHQPSPPTETTATVEDGSNRPLDLSGDRLYWLSTGVRQIFFMAWPLFQDPRSVFAHVGVLQPCMALEDAVDARGLSWQRYVRRFVALYENPRYRGAAGKAGPGGRGQDARPRSSPSGSPSDDGGSPASTPPGAGSTGSSNNTGNNNNISTAYLDGLLPSFPSSGAPPHKVVTLWQSYKEGEAYVRSAGMHDEGLTRAAYKRLAARLAVGMAYIADTAADGDGVRPGSSGGGGQPEVTRSDMVRYVTTLPMMCFGPLLALISSGDARMLVLLLHLYRVVATLLPGGTYWWCRRRVELMQEVLGRELQSRGLEVCTKGQSEIV